MGWVFGLIYLLSAATAKADISFERTYFEDKTASLTAGEVVARAESLAWRPLPGGRANFGLSPSRFWLRFKVPQTAWSGYYRGILILDMPRSSPDHVSLYLAKDGKVLQAAHAGLAVPLSRRGDGVLRSGAPTFRVPRDLDPGAEYFLSVDGRMPLGAPLRLMQAPDYEFDHWVAMLILGAFFGALLVAMVFNGFLALALQSRVYWSYTIFVACLFLVFASYEGLTVQVLWPESPWWAMREIHVYIALAALCYGLFTREFLESHRIAPKVDRVLLAFLALSTLRGFWYVLAPSGTVAIVGGVATMGVNVSVLGIAWRAFRKGVRSAPYFFLSSIAFHLLVLVFQLQAAGLYWLGAWVAKAPEVGTMLEVVLLSFALADRIRATNLEVLRQKAALVHTEKMSALGRLAGEIAHEINNPLAIVHGNAVLIRGMDLPSQAKEFAGTIEHTANRISKVVKGMRGLARDSRGDPLVPVFVSSILQDAAALCGDRARSAGVRVELPDLIPDVSVRCRSSEICQVLVNLLNNAIDAVAGTPQPRVRIDARRSGGNLELSVIDNGPGIPKEFRSKVLEPFFTTKEAGKGLGVGLSISATIVQAHGGTLRLDDSTDHTRFVFDLELAQGDFPSA